MAKMNESWMNDGKGRKSDPRLCSTLIPIIPLSRFSLVFSQGRSQVGGGGSWGARDPPLVGLLLSKQPTISRWRKRHDNILAVKAIVEKRTFLKFVFL